MLRAAGEAQHFSRKDQGTVIHTTVALTVGLLWQVECVMTKTRAQDWRRPDRAYSILTLPGVTKTKIHSCGVSFRQVRVAIDQGVIQSSTCP